MKSLPILVACMLFLVACQPAQQPVPSQNAPVPEQNVKDTVVVEPAPEPTPEPTATVPTEPPVKDLQTADDVLDAIDGTVDQMS